jgi:hypothetical protein
LLRSALVLAFKSDEKFYGSNSIKSFESAACGLRSAFNPAKILNLNNLAVKYWIDWT